ncbi:MAG TPA: hypothetical protein VIU63_10765, partial [Nitrospira sp.]
HVVDVARRLGPGLQQPFQIAAKRVLQMGVNIRAALLVEFGAELFHRFALRSHLKGPPNRISDHQPHSTLVVIDRPEPL